MNVGRSITYLFQDPHWIKKVAIGGLLVFVPIFGWFVLGGYFMRLVRQIVEGTELPLPKWDDFGRDFVRGFKVCVVSVVWAFPVWVLQILNDLSGSGDSTANGAVCLTYLIALALAFFQPLYMSRLAMTDSIGSALDFVAIFHEARRAFMPLVLVLASAIVISIAAMFGVFLCIVGVVFTVVLGYGMIAHLYGQVRRQVDGEPPLAPSTPY